MDGSNLKPETHQPSGGGASKPKPSERLDSDSHAQESQLASGDQGQGGGPQKAGSASETAKDIKSVAKAGSKPGVNLKEDKADIKKAYDEKGAGAAAGEVGRKAAGKATQGALDATGVGAPLGATAGKLVEKGLKKENLKKILIVLTVTTLLPLLFVGIIIAVLVYAASNPFKFVQQVITDPKSREFAVQAAKLAKKAAIGSEDTYKKYGYVEIKPGQAIAAPVATATPKPGSIEEKILKINLKNARYQSAFTAPDCPYSYTTKDLTDPKTGATTSVIDEVKNKSGEVVDKNNNFVVSYCIVQSMPLYNMMVRTEKTREVNAFSNTTLNYADSKDSTNIKGRSPAEVRKYVYDKTYNRITSKEDLVTGIADVDVYIAEVREKLVNDQNPDSVQFDFKGDATSDNAINETLCAFTRGYLSDANLRKGILTRLNSGQRSGIKSNTLSSTRELGLLSNEELSPTFGQLDGWSASRAYSQNVYGTQSGTAIDPERLGNTTYGASYRTSLALLYSISKNCGDDGFFNSIFNPGNEKTVKILYDTLRQLIVDQSNGKFTSIDGFGLDQLMVGVIRMGGGSAVSGLEAGTQNFNNQSQGFRTLSNQYMMRIGGRFLTRAESSQLDALSENTRQDVESKNGLAYRLFAEDNIRSLANIIRYETPRTTGELGRKGKDYIAGLSNPIKLLADLSSGFSRVVLGKSTVAFAASATGDAYMRIDTIGLPTNEFENTDPIANSDYIQNLKANGTEKEKAVLGYFEKCSKANIPTKSIFTRLYNVEIVDDEAEVIGKKDGLINSVGGLLKEGGEISYPAINNDFTLLGFANRTEFVACEIYLMPESEHETARDYDEAKQKDLFGFKINELAKKYHLYLYANSMVDLMVELSSTERTDSIYATSASASQPAPGGGGVGGGGIVAGDTSNLTCPAGTIDKNIGDGYAGGKLYKIRLCDAGGIIVNAQIAANVLALLNKSSSEGLKLAGGGFRTMKEQEAARARNGCGAPTNPSSACTGDPVARPGYSNHQMGLAIDFNNCSTKSTACHIWLKGNAATYGLFNLPSEPWHWSVDGR